MNAEPLRKLLIANRGEISLRILRAARDLGIVTVAVHSQDDAQSPPLDMADKRVRLAGTGPAAYLDSAALVAAAMATGCDAVHPGYGFLSENAGFAVACARAGLVFVGPSPEQLAIFGDKGRALELARGCGVPVLPATPGGASFDEIAAFFDAHAGTGGIVIKAVGGGGGRGMRAVGSRDALEQAYQRCRSEARSAFGVDAVYAEQLVARARHIEVQVVGDGRDVVALGDRDCTLQRRFQKVVEIAPSPVLGAALRRQMTDCALAMARAVGYRSLGTFEFLVGEALAGRQGFVFIEANPRLQVEHTVTEAVTGIDLVAVQLGIAAGRSLAETGLDPASPPRSRGFAIQFRLNAESVDARGVAKPASGTLLRFDLPSGPGVRVDTHARAGYAPPAAYDTLLAKLVVWSSGSFEDAVRRGQRALRELRIEGLATNQALLQALADHDDFRQQRVHTRHLDTMLGPLLARAAAIEAARVQPEAGAAGEREKVMPEMATPEAATGGSATADPARAEQVPPGLVAVRAPMAARVVEIAAAEGDLLRPGEPLVVLDAMKMEHVVEAASTGRVASIAARVGEQVIEAQVLALLEPAEEAGRHDVAAGAGPSTRVRADLERVLERHALVLDAARPQALARRRARGQRMARENIDDLCDAGSFVEYGALAVAAQSRRRSMADLVANTPADGLVAGIATVNRGLFGPERSRLVVMSYDATVLAGTQGLRNHEKADRMLELAARQRLPVVLFAEGGGGRPGDVDMPIVAGLHLETFAAYARLSGSVPVVGIVSGRCFAGNAALVGCSDVIIATRDSNLGMGGPAMIEGGGLGVYPPEAIGPSTTQHRNGVIDVLVDDEAQAVAAARRYLAMFQGSIGDWQAPDRDILRQVVPENRLRVYDTRLAMAGVADTGSILELRSGFGVGIHTALARIGGRPIGLMASNPRHLSGAIDADAADKAARFMQLCDAHDLPIVSLIDTPGFMVGPEIEARAQVRHVSRMFVVGAGLRVPFFAVVMRKCYGLGAMAMAAGGLHSPNLAISWPTGEFGGMGLEGAVRLGYRKELEALPEGPQRDELYRRLVAEQYERGAAMNMAATLEIDAVIDPAQTRHWLVSGLQAAAPAARERGPRDRFIDTW